MLMTIGHSTHSIEAFLALLRASGVKLLIDVRSIPYSRRMPHFRREALDRALSAAAIEYSWRGDVLGGRPQEAALQRKGKPDYAAIAAQPRFQAALDSVVEAASRRPAALMCAERDPLDCHRFHFLSAPLAGRGIDIVHLHGDGGRETQAEAVARLDARDPQGRLF